MYISQDQSLEHYLSGYNLGATYYKIEDLVKAIVSECFDLVKSVGINLGEVVETVAENLAAKLVSKGIKKVDDLKDVSNTYDLSKTMTNEIFDYLTDILHVISPWAGDGDEPALWWNSQSDEGSVIVETARELILGRINSLINKAIKSSGLDVHESSDDVAISDDATISNDAAYYQTGVHVIEYGGMTQASKGPEQKGEIKVSGSSTGMALPIAIGGAALLYFIL